MIIDDGGKTLSYCDIFSLGLSQLLIKPIGHELHFVC
jgi:hypothetical protein